MNFFDFLRQNFAELLALTREHVFLVFVSTAFAVLVGVPLGILLTRKKSLQAPVLGVANILQTVPSLALSDEPDSYTHLTLPTDDTV